MLKSDKKNYTKADLLVFGSPLIEEDEIAEVVSCLRSGWIGTGPKVQQFEDDFSRYKQATFSVAVNSCTAALHLSMIAAGITVGDEVITSAMTFCATVNAIIHSGATPVLADCDKKTFCLDPEDIERKITKKTKAIVPVHFAGYPCDMDRIMSLAQKYNLKVIEDCAHAIETMYHGRPAGGFGDFGCFSFYVTKNVVTGEGGMVTTQRKEDADRVKMLALHGMSKDAWKRFSDDGYKHYQVVELGFKYNMMDIQAALGIHQLRRVDELWQRRKQIWHVYHKAFQDMPISLPFEGNSSMRHAYHLFPILINEKKTGMTRDQFIDAVYDEHIGTGVHYRSIPMHEFYQRTFGWKPEDYPISYQVGEETVSLPLSAKLSNCDIDRVVSAVRKVLK